MGFSEILAKIATPPFPAIVVAVVAVLLIIYVYITKAINGKKAVEKPKKAPVAPAASPVAAHSAGPAASSGDLELVGTDEKTAAVIMAIVSDKSGIPLNRLQFKSITLMEDK